MLYTAFYLPIIFRTADVLVFTRILRMENTALLQVKTKMFNKSIGI